MSRKRTSELDVLLDEILTDAYGDEEQLWALRQALEDNVQVPCDATIVNEPCEGDEIRLRRKCASRTRRHHPPARWSKHVVAAADLL